MDDVTLVGSYFSLEGIRMILSSMGILGEYFYLVSSVLFVLIPLPLVYYIIYIITGDRRVSLSISLIFALFGVVYLFFLYTYGISGPHMTYWGSIYSINSDVALVTFISGLFIVPTSMIIGLMFLILFGKILDPTKTRIILNLFSVSFVFDFILANSIVQSGEIQMASRIFVFLGTVLGYMALFHPETFKIPPFFEQYEDGEDEFEQI